MTDPLIKALPGTSLSTKQWNEMQTSMRDEIAALIKDHNHTGEKEGKKLAGTAFEPAVVLNGVKLRGTKPSITFGEGEPNAAKGKIEFNSADNSLDIFGAGSSDATLKLAFHAKGGSTHLGALTVKEGILTAEGNVIAKKTLTVDGALTTRGALTIGGQVTINNELVVTGALSTKSSLTVTQDMTADGKLSVSGDITARKALTVDGDVKANKTLTVSDVLTANGGITANGALTVNGPLKANKAVTIEGALEVKGSLTIGGQFTIKNSLTVEGNLTVKSFTTNGTLTAKEGIAFDDQHDAFRIVRGYVTSGGMSVLGAGYTSKKTGIVGVYEITFDPQFKTTPIVVATQIYPGSDVSAVSTFDNAVVLTTSATGCQIKVGNAEGDGAARDFCFVAMG